MASFAFTNGSASVTSTASSPLTVNPGQSVTLQNSGSAIIFLGGSTVTSSGANIGYSLAAGASLTLPMVSQQPHQLFAIVASTASTLTWLTSH